MAPEHLLDDLETTVDLLWLLAHQGLLDEVGQDLSTDRSSE